jgi:hypothetical protein
LRSVFTGIVLNAARTCRVSSNSIGKPACRIPAYSHCDSGPASNPILVSFKPSEANQAISACGSLATLASLTILPLPSTTQMLDRSNDTSIAA